MSRSQFLVLSALMLLASFIGGMLATLIFRPGSALAQVDEDIVMAKGFYLTNTIGEIVSTWETSEQGYPMLKFFDGNERTKAFIGIADGFPGVVIESLQGTEHLVISLHDNRPAITFWDGSERIRLGLYLSKEGNGSIEMMDVNGINRVLLQIADTLNIPALTLKSASGKKKAVLFSDNDGNGGLGFLDQFGNIRTSFAYMNGIPKIYMWDLNSKVIWSAP